MSVAVTNIYQTALAAKFDSIMETIAVDLGYGNILSGLTVECRDIVQNNAEQSVLDWAVERTKRPSPRRPITNLQHLLDEYCILSEYL